MSRIAVLTPDPSDEGRHGRWGEVFERMAAPLRAEGVTVDGPAWTDAVDLAAYDLVLPMTVWGYHRAGPQWLAATHAWEQAHVRLRNPASVLRWNADKRYLGGLAERGAPVVPTVYADRITPEALQEACERLGTDRLVAKPQVSANAYQTLRWSPGEPLDGAPEGAAMIQPYLPLIEREGEVSIIYFGGRFSHAIRKVPGAGDFRVQPEFGSDIRTTDPAPDERATAEAVLESIDETLLYARVDLVRDLDGRPALIELELIEPDLYLGYAPDRGRAFVEAVLAELSSTNS